MENNKVKSTFSAFGLLIIAVIWGLSFVIMKDAISEAPVLYVLAIRFLLSGIPLSIIFFKKFFKAKKKDYIRGIIVGCIIICCVLILLYMFQSYCFKYTTSIKNSLLTARYFVVIPFVSWIIFKKKPKLISVLFTIIAFGGVSLILIQDLDTVNIGDILTIIGGLFYAIQIVLVSEFAKDSDPIFLTMIEFLVVGLVLICFAPIEGKFPTYLFTNPDLLWRILFLGFICTLLCFLFQSILQKYVQVVASGIILSLEAPIGAIGGVLLHNDPITPVMIIGMILLFIAVVGIQTYEPIIERIKMKMNPPPIEPADESTDEPTNE